MSDDGFHEIQLNGKQLIFLFMTAALILVVAFLTGVLVGRGVQPRGKDATVAADPVATPAAAAADASAAPAQPAAPPVTALAPPTPAEDDLSYDSRLHDKEPPAETIKPAPPAQAAKPAALPPASAASSPRNTAVPAGSKAATSAPGSKAVAPPPVAAQAPAASKVDASLAAEPAGNGYYLKIVAYRDRTQAEGVAKRLSGKGYSTYVVPLSGRGPVLYSVRVGKYKTRREADVARRRLEKEEQFKPLISH